MLNRIGQVRVKFDRENIQIANMLKFNEKSNKSLFSALNCIDLYLYVAWQYALLCYRNAVHARWSNFFAIQDFLMKISQ